MMLSKFLNDETGTTAIEYGLIAGLLSMAIIGALTAAGVNLQANFQSIGDLIEAAIG
jgi:pilus assembly protein Flp/PilA